MGIPPDYISVDHDPDVQAVVPASSRARSFALALAAAYAAVFTEMVPLADP